MLPTDMHRFNLAAAPLIYTVALLFLVNFATAQEPPPKPSEDVVSTATQDALTKTIAGRLREQLTAFKKGDAATYNTYLTEDYRSITAIGTLHFYRPTSQEFASFPIDQFIVSQLQAVPIGQEGALVTYILQLIPLNTSALKLAVGEVWVKQNGVWKCQYSQATVTF